jgi:hypothetical protein
MENQNIQSTGCCERFDPAPWQDKEVEWNNKLFVIDHVKSFLHIPINFGNIVVKNMELIKKAQAQQPEQIMLTDENSLWGSDIYISVDREIPGAKMATLSGKFMTRVFDGPFNMAGKFAREMNKYVKSKGKDIKKLYFSYTTCPKCAKAYGKNYILLFAKID